MEYRCKTRAADKWASKIITMNLNRIQIRYSRYAVLFWAVIFGLILPKANAQEEKQNYVWPTDTLVLQKLHHWQGEKFGLLMHWGTYSEWGVVESWSICPEDEGWTQHK